MDNTSVSVIVATLNEEANIEHVLDTALRDDAVTEVIIADGGSEDATTQRVLDRAQSDPRVILLHNPDRGQSAGLNRAAQRATGVVLVRLDGHTRYADDYVSSSIKAWRPGVAVGGPMLAEGAIGWPQATAHAMKDPLAIGPAKFRHADGAEDVDTVYLGTFERSEFLRIGGYRTFPSGTVEDTDLYYRWRATGGSVRVDPSITCWYHPRESWSGLLRQYFRYGIGKAELFWLNGRLPSARPLAPAVLVGSAAVFTMIGIAWTWIPMGLLGAAWTAALATVAVRADDHRTRTAVVAATMHLGYGTGIWWGLARGRPSVRTLGVVEQGSLE